jgi:hypothetical protein
MPQRNRHVSQDRRAIGESCPMNPFKDLERAQSKVWPPDEALLRCEQARVRSRQTCATIGCVFFVEESQRVQKQDFGFFVASKRNMHPREV